MPESVETAWRLLLELAEAILVPDWGDWIDAIPLGLLGVVVLVGTLVVRRWVRYAAVRPIPVRAPRGREGVPLSPRAAILPLAAVPVGALLAVAALVFLSDPTDGVPSLPPIGYALLLAGIATALGGVAAAVLAWEAQADTAARPRIRSRGSASARLAAVAPPLAAAPAPIRRLALVAAGAALAFGAVAWPGASATGGVGVHLPPLLAGLVLALAGVAAAIRDWERAG